jgi:dihydropteroate synthase
MRKPPLLMGVLNVTPDSFSDGGRFYTKGEALLHAERLVQEGAAIIDIGGESTRPGALEVSVQEEMDRVLPVVEAIRSTLPVQISVDTRKFEIAREAVRSGASIINDISGGSDVRLLELMRTTEVTLALMHMRGTPQNMQENPSYPKGVVPEVRSFLAERVRAYREAGISKDRLWVDPGIGFGKTLQQNLELLSQLKELVSVGGRLMIGTSRKSFLAHLSGDPKLEMEKREEGTISTSLWAYAQGASVFRVHRVAPFARALQAWQAVETPPR